MRRLAAVLAIAALALTGCTSATPAPSPTPLAITDAANLIGFWTVDDSFSDEESILRIDNDEIAEWSECGLRTGQWNARGDLIALLFTDSQAGCEETVVASYSTVLSMIAPSWRTGSNTFNPIDRGTYELVDVHGELLATLTRGANPPKVEDVDSSLYAQPVADSDATARFAKLPAVAANGADYKIRPGTYTSEGGDAIAEFAQLESEPHISFFENSFSGRDECGNEVDGVWSSEAASILILLSDESRSSCESMPLYEWLSNAARVGEPDPGLTLLNGKGKLVVKLDLDLEPEYLTGYRS